MADDDRTFSESELTAIVADRVTRETAEVAEDRDQLKAENDELKNKLDVETSAKEAAAQRADEAEKALTDFKAEIDNEREQSARRDERIKKVREVAGHLSDEFFEDQARLDRLVAMSDEDFAGYLDDMRQTAANTSKTTTSEVPRQTAMNGSEPKERAGSAVSRFLLGTRLPETAGKEG